MLNTTMTLRCRDKLLDFSTPRIMAILNLTPDSFYDGGRYDSQEKALGQLDRLVADGADIIDIGPMSSRPGAEELSEREESGLLIPFLDQARKAYPEMIFSVDTYRTDVARQALDHGADMINDIRGGISPQEMYSLVQDYEAAYVMMHMRGTAQTMTSLTEYADLVGDILDYFIERLKIAEEVGLTEIILDPGIGFAKGITQNYELVRRASAFQVLGRPVLYGISRKSFLYKPAGLSPDEVLPDTTAIHLQLLLSGVQMLRVHDVKEAVRAVEISKRLREPAQIKS